METTELVLEHDRETNTDFACPICGGPLIPLRDYIRCTRCCHTFCESCEGGVSNGE